MKRLLALAVCAGITCAACGAPQSAPPQPKSVKVSNVGPFTVSQMQIPSVLVDGSQTYQIGPNTMVRASDTAPYVLQRRTLTARRWITVFRCAQPLIGTDIYGPLTGFLCPAPPGTPTRRNRLILFDPNGQARTYNLPVRLPTSRQWFTVAGYVFGGKNGDLAWIAAETYPVGSTEIDSGLIDLAAGRRVAPPKPIALRVERMSGGVFFMPSGSPFLSPSDALFLVGLSAVDGENVPVYRWSRANATLTMLGEVPLYWTLVVGDDGTVWAIRLGSQSTGLQQSGYFLREVPGRHVQSWMIDGRILGGGPGYVVYIPKSDATGLDIFFPLQHRTLHYRNLHDPGKMLVLAALFQVDSKMQAVVTGEGTKTLEIQISK
ncbi:MAG: hypothetical protein M0Z66_13525 [Thermaerobacter sp.]|nr:hypothetical protein [Thermaerobacter sp.]